MTAFGSLGSNLSELQNSSFVQWFSLEKAEANGTVTVFRPSGARFHDDVALDASAALDGALLILRLCLSRSFIEGAQWRAFASDIAASFLRDALGESPLSAAFEQEMAASTQLVGPSGVPGPVPLSPEDAGVFQVYRGTEQHAGVARGTFMLAAENGTRNGVPVTILSVAAR